MPELMAEKKKKPRKTIRRRVMETLGLSSALEWSKPSGQVVAVPKTDVMGLPLARVTQAETLNLIDSFIMERTPRLVITANLHFAMLSQVQPMLRWLNRKADLVYVEVKDQGVGIPEALKDSLFELAAVAGRQGTGGEETNGLGLLISKEIIEQHGGKIWFESAEGKGSSFFFTLPAN